MVRVSKKRIKELQKLLKEQTGRDYTDEEAQTASLAIMRFVLAKEHRRQELQKSSIDSKDSKKDKQSLSRKDSGTVLANHNTKR